MPDDAARVASAQIAHLAVHPLGGEAQRQFAQAGQVRLLEKILLRGGRALAQVNLALGQPLAQCLGRQVHQFNFVGQLENGIGHGFLHHRAGDLPHGVRARLDVLDVDAW